MPTTPKSEIDGRILILQRGLIERGLDAAMIVQHVDLYYLAGTLQTCHLLVPASGAPRLLVRKVIERARSDSALADIQPLTSMRKLPDHLKELCGPRPWRIGMELDVLPVKTFQFYLKTLGAESKIEDIASTILTQRQIKSAWELEQIRLSGTINDGLYAAMSDVLRPGMSTVALQGSLETAARELGNLGVSRFRGMNMECSPGVVVSGPGGAAPSHSQFPIGGRGIHPAMPHGADLDPIVPGIPIIFDFLTNATGYHNDQTRMAVVGAMPDDAQQIFDSMQTVLREVESILQPGSIPVDIYEAALAVAAAHGLGDAFMGPPGYGAGFLGHSIGLEVNEMPVLAPKFEEPLCPGHVFAIEPKYTHPDYGVIGLENTYAITETGFKRLSAAPEDVLVVDAP